MKIVGVASGLMLVLAAGSARAVPVYDTITGQTNVAGLVANTTSGHGPLGDSFSASSTETITSVTLAMELKSAAGAGSELVYLVPNGSEGNPSLPSYTPGVPVTLTNATLLGTIFDNNPLLSTQSYTNITLTPSLTIGAGNYWIELVDGASANNGNGDSTISIDRWGYDADINGLGVPTSGNIVSTASAPPGTLVGDGTATPALTGEVFELQIQTPEPSSLAVLGAGLLCLGIGRRARKLQR
ncbi:MAG TPA: PEP-CTERM sorting domain-containing protein [Acetobacteraceae bacterium]|jgi:hypothetical protein|nr:PEP-CTERM sorting domain-containing protein [Acetobacteraceae bacterium]